MSGNSDDREDNPLAKWLLVAGFAVGVAAGYLRIMDQQPTGQRENLASREASSIAAPSPNLQDRLNTDLKDTAIRSGLKKETMEEDNADSAAISNSDFENDQSQRPIPLVLKQQNNSGDVVRDEIPQTYEPPTPDQRVSLMLQRNQWLKNYDQAYQREYIRQFLKNAREHGVNVRLNKNLDVTGFSLNRSNQPLLFPSTATGTK